VRPVDAQFTDSQQFGSYATAGVTGNEYGTEVQQLVAQYGNYQPYGHAGKDIACPTGTPVHAIADGTVLWADWGTNLPGDDSWGPSGYFRRWALYKTFPGIVTVIQHDGWISVYAHLSEAPLNPGDAVTEGQQIALSGNTRSPGVSLGAHLHVEALVDLTYSTGNGLIYGRTDPTPYFGGITAQGAITPQEDTLSQAEVDQIYKFTMTRIQQAQDATIKAILDELKPWIQGSDNKTGDRVIMDARAQIAAVPSAVLNAQFKLADGTVTNLAGILSAINAKPVTGQAATVIQQADPQAVVTALAIQLAKK
jgi:hypothetical protein